MDEMVNKLLGAAFAGLILSTGFCLFMYDEFNREIEARRAANWLYRVLR